ncbi:efflux RND transporter periplasmic adaptor subunit [Neptunicella marina]|uniref:Efflux RND transporter periplasmic adaptor subunit n=1 Tax=Neptunicella marina TaxID=2125989 RepID=A0A8J6ITV3_9ALTE|nr:efflux RND transporter periplasmic adaptor subunit [Neptunicella marina]MBC3765328.1 efflux RND transporter periplasmic adaptor subunit [Neptunicella marina]
MRSFVILFLMVWVQAMPVAIAAEQQHEFTAELEQQHTRYMCPMHHHIVRDHPGKCPICGMDLQPKTQQNSMQMQPMVDVRGDMQQAMNIVTAPVMRGDMWKYIKTFGQIQVDESRISHVHPRMSGWIEKLNVDTEGQTVKKGQLLYTLYSPDLVVAQDDFLQAQKNLSGSNRDYLLSQAKRRLSLLGVDPSFIATLEKEGKTRYSVPFYATQSGVITRLSVRQGMYVEPAREMLAIADLTHLWVLADVFENQFDWLKLGKPADIHLPSIGIEAAEASIEYIYPRLDPVSRSIKVRLNLVNPLMRIKPGMTAEVAIYGGPKKDVLNIPLQAVLQSGNKNRVVVQKEDGSFVVQEVELGMQVNQRVEILSGLTEQQKVVVSGQFLIDAEANLDAAINRMQSHQH